MHIPYCYKRAYYIRIITLPRYLYETHVLIPRFVAPGKMSFIIEPTSYDDLYIRCSTTSLLASQIYL